MSLLLDALKTRESSAPSSAEPDEEALDGPEALKILTAKMHATSALTLEASPPGVSAVDTAVAPDIAAVLPEIAAASRNPPIGRTVAAALRSGLPPTSSRAAPLAATPARRYAVMLAAAVAVVIVVMVGKSLLYKNTNQISYPEAAESPPAAAGQPATRSDPSTVQVPSRPASQFSGVGGAPEIDLHEDVVLPAAMRAPLRRVGKTIRPEIPATEIGAAAPNPSMPRRSFSVTPSAGVASIDAHIETGYRALASGNVATAQREYHSALDLDPNNVDALLGTASAASRAANSTLAAAAYAKVLRLEPGNKDATAALTILNHDPTATEANESRLKVLIASDNERRPALHAALAGVYAADRRWADAAQEYFIALSMDPGDSDLAFNLAASLDQNHNSAAALTYYAQALAFAKLRTAQIDVRAIEARISQLQARTEIRPATPQAAP
jgi:Tfp pilus assembly protein PilF